MVETRQLRLQNGLHVTLIHQPDAQQAAALAQVAAGSHDEPDAWPGLAHLLEHLLFSDSASYQGSSRLMPWVQAAGGRLNATTLPRSSAWFFEVDAGLLAEGVARLADMLAAPQFTPEAIGQEAAVIDAEYRLIQQHTPSRREAALFTRVVAPSTFQRFHIGSQQAFADSGALKQALHQFHQRFFHPGQMQLWLQGPQSLEALHQLALRFAARLPQAGELSGPADALRFGADGDIALQTPGPGQLWITTILRGEPDRIRDNVTLLREFLQDEAPGGAMAGLRQRGWAEQLEARWLSLDKQQGWLALQIDTAQPDAVCAWYDHALQALADTSSRQQRHYLRLAQQRFAALTPLDQLRERAFGFPPPAHAEGFPALLQQLRAAPRARLWSDAGVQGELTESQGFRLHLQPWRSMACYEAQPNIRFHPQSAHAAALTPPAGRAPLLHLAAGDAPATLLLRPDFFTSLRPATATALDRRLRPLFALLRHQGGVASWRESQGSWQLELQIPRGGESWLASLPDALRLERSGDAADPADDVAIRELLRQLPQAVSAAVETGSWRAALYGGSAEQYDAIARWLAPVVTASGKANAPDAQGKRLIVDHPGHDSALLLFLPCPSGVSLAALRAVSLIMEPRFFQRMRVEQQIGYVVSCRYHRCVDRDSILFALQSPDIAPDALLAQCHHFLQQLQTAQAGEELERCRARLTAQLAPPQSAALALQQALRSACLSDDLSEAAVAALTPAALQQAQAALLDAWPRAVILQTR